MKTSSYRIPVDIRANIILDSINYEVLIINLSADGACIEHDDVINKIVLAEGALLRLEFLTPREELIKMEGKVVWSKTVEQEDERYNVGVQFIDIPAEYNDFFHYLYVRDMRVM